MLVCVCRLSFFFFFNDTATTEIYTLSLHDALPIYIVFAKVSGEKFTAFIVERTFPGFKPGNEEHKMGIHGDRKSTRLNSSHSSISYAVFCLKKKKKNNGAARYG